jgi:hypothetical protein
MPRLRHAEPLIHAQQFELEEPLQSVADDELIKACQTRRDAEQLGFVNSFAGRTVVKGVENDTAGPAFGKGKLILVDEPSLEGESDEHADERHDRHPKHDVPPGEDDVGHHHVSGKAGGERHGHVTGGGRDRLHRVVLQDREIFPEADARQEAEHGKGQNDGGEVDAEGHTGFAGHIEIRGGKDAAEKETGEPGAERELRQIAPINFLKPPAIFFFARPGARFFVGEVG